MLRPDLCNYDLVWLDLFRARLDMLSFNCCHPISKVNSLLVIATSTSNCSMVLTWSDLVSSIVYVKQILCKVPLWIYLEIMFVLSCIYSYPTTCCHCLHRKPGQVGWRVLCLAKGQPVILSGTAYSVYSQLTSISDGHSPICNLGTRWMEVITSLI